MGWGVGVGITLVVVSLEFKNYGGGFHDDDDLKCDGSELIYKFEDFEDQHNLTMLSR